MIATQNDIAERLASLFREAGSAHHKAFASTNGDDPEWPIWYAEFLQPKLNLLLSVQWTKSEVVYLLLRAEKERSALAQSPTWPEFYARLFIKQLASSHN
jgi:hypothetical protein